MTLNWVLSSLFFVLLCAGVGYFYVAAYSGKIWEHVILAALFLPLATDGFFLSWHLMRRPSRVRNASFDWRKVTIIIPCYNGEKIIGETIRQALRHVSKHQIIVVSDTSSDKTVGVVRPYGVKIIENTVNMNKALSISSAMKHVTTEYVLPLDDDTLIGGTFIPTSLLDEGYSAVAFNVMPEETGTLLNKLQIFEYRKSMYLGKNIRSSVGAIGNVSGAIGLFRTKDLLEQVRLHSGQFGGEDQQRTMLVHLIGQGKGIVYADSAVHTLVPETLRQLFRQRAYRWGMAVHETFVLCLMMIASPRTHYILKAERAYLLFVFLTDPIRMVFWPLLFLNPRLFGTLFLFYLFLETLSWLKTGRQDPWYVVALSPLYALVRNVARFVAHFYWFKVKFDYLVKRKFHRFITDRRLIAEYAVVTGILLIFWVVTLHNVFTVGGRRIAVEMRQSLLVVVDLYEREIGSRIESPAFMATILEYVRK